MLALLMAAAVTTSATSADAMDPARLLPAETLIYFGSTSLQASFEASQETAMSKILGEAEMKAFLAEPLAAANQIITKGMAMAAGEIEEAQAAAEQFGVDLALDEETTFISIDSGSPPPVGQAFLALTSIGMPGMNPNGSPLPEVGLVIGVQLLSPGITDMMRGVWAQIPFPDANGSHGGIDYLGKMSPGGTVCFAVLGDLAVISTSTTAMHGVIDRHQGASTGGSLADSAEYRLMLKSAGGLIPGGSSYLVRVQPLAGLCRLAMQMGLPASGEVSPEEAQQFLELFDAIGFSAIELVGGVSAVGKEGKIYATSVTSLDANQPGLITQLVTGGEPIGLDVFETVPGDCMGANAAALGTVFADMYDFMTDMLGRFEPGAIEEMNAMLAMFMGEYDLRDDILANINGRMVNYTVPGQGMMGTPDTVMRVGVRDGERLVGALGQLLDSASQQAGLPVGLELQDHEGTPWYKIDISATPAAMMMQPGIVFMDGEVVFCTSEGQLKSIMNGSTGESLWGNENFSTFGKSLQNNGGVLSLTFTDLSRSFGTQYQQIAGMAGMIPGLSDLPMDMSKLPAEGSITRHLGESYAGQYRTEEGMYVTKSVSQFQMGDFVPLLLIAGAIAGGQQMGIELDEIEAVIDPSEQVMNDLRELKASIQIYKITQSNYPGSLEALLQPLDDFPNGAYLNERLPTDPWGNGYRFELAMHPKKRKEMPKLWSLGPNGIDENGEGDDILKF